MENKIDTNSSDLAKETGCSDDWHKSNTAKSLKSFGTIDSGYMKKLGDPLENLPTNNTIDDSLRQIDLEDLNPPVESKENDVENMLELENKTKRIDDIDIEYSFFTRKQRLAIFIIVIYIGFLGPMSGNIYIPALPTLQTAFNTTPTVINATVSAFMGVFAIGPIFWGMFADNCGRKWLYLSSLLLVTIINLLLAVLPANLVSLFILRCFQAFGSSSVITLGSGTVTDITPGKHRGKAIAYFMLGPNMGPIIGPIIAGLILINGDYWRWLFGFTCILSAVGFLLVLVFLPETLRCIVGNGDPRWKNAKEILLNSEIQKSDDTLSVSEKYPINKLSTSNVETKSFSNTNSNSLLTKEGNEVINIKSPSMVTDSDLSINKNGNNALQVEDDLESDDNKITSDVNFRKWQFFQNIGIQKPVCNDVTFQLLYPRPTKPNVVAYYNIFKSPPVFISSIGTALLFGNYYAFSVTFSKFLADYYSFSRLGAGLAFICPGVSMIFGSQIGGHLSDYLRKRWLMNNPENNGYPLEKRLELQLFAILLNSMGCIGYGWSVQKRLDVVLVFYFSACIAFSLTWCSNTTMTYLTELLAKRTSAAVSICSLFRNAAAAISAAIIVTLCNEMGIGWCFTGLGFLNILPFIGVVTLIKIGKKWRNIEV